nr:putative reverse transcriptase domain-containing protein [Tanacetum cinerariifolium]
MPGGFVDIGTWEVRVRVWELFWYGAGCDKKGSEKRKDGGETDNKEDAMGENKRDRTGKGFVATDSSKKEYKGPQPKCAKCNYHHQETTPCRTCFNCNQSSHVARDFRAIAKRAVTPVT